MQQITESRCIHNMLQNAEAKRTECYKIILQTDLYLHFITFCHILLFICLHLLHSSNSIYNTNSLVTFHEKKTTKSVWEK